MPNPTHRARAAAVALCLAALTACGSGSHTSGRNQVASLPHSATPTAGKGRTAGAEGRPQMRLDDSPERRAALIGAWDACLIAHGAKRATGRTAPGPSGKPAYPVAAEPVPAAAKDACEHKLPLEPPELNPSLNPHYRADSIANVKCLRAHGVKVHLVADTSVDADGLAWTYDSSTTKVPDDMAQIENTCQLAAFGGKSDKSGKR
jgi:hypothetical protein